MSWNPDKADPGAEHNDPEDASEFRPRTSQARPKYTNAPRGQACRLASGPGMTFDGMNKAKTHRKVRQLMAHGILVASLTLALQMLAGERGHAAQLFDLHPNMNWQGDIESHAGALAGKHIAAERAQARLGCERYCAELPDIFNGLVRVAIEQVPEAATTHWQLVVTRSESDAAWSLADGHVFISEAFIAREKLDRDAIAFVLAHEIAHILNRDQADTLDLAKAVVPLGINASLDDIYATLDFDPAVLLKLSPLLMNMETEADRTGLLLLAIAGHDPDRAIRFLDRLTQETQGTPLITSHPDSDQRLRKLRQLLPMAHRIRERRAALMPH